MRKTIATLLLLTLALVCLSGCWDVRDVNNTAFALAMGIDKASSQSSNIFKVTLEFADPVPGQPMPKRLVSSAEGSSVLQAIKKSRRRLAVPFPLVI